MSAPVRTRRSEHPGPLVEREVGVTRMEPRSQRWLKTSTISRPRRESCSGSLSSRLSSRASISSWTRAAAVLTPHRHSPLAGGQARPQGRVGLAGAAGAYGDDVFTARGEPPGRNTPPALPLCGPDGPADLPDVPKHREAGKKRVRGSESKTGPSREGTGAAPRAGESPGEKHPLRALCGPDGPAALPDVQNHREGGKTPVRASGSETEIFKPQGPPWGNPGTGAASHPAPLCSNTEMMAAQARPGETVREAAPAVTGYAQEMAGAPGRMHPHRAGSIARALFTGGMAGRSKASRLFHCPGSSTWGEMIGGNSQAADLIMRQNGLFRARKPDGEYLKSRPTSFTEVL